MIIEKACPTLFARDRDNTVETNASRSGCGKTFLQKQNDKTIRPIALASRYSIGAEKNSIGEFDILAVVRGLKIISFSLYGKLAYFQTNHQPLEQFVKRNWAYQQYSARITR